MKILHFCNFQKTFESITKEDKDYIYVRHKLHRGAFIKSHYHKTANEWLIIDNGKFEVQLENEKKIFNLKKQITVIYFPHNLRHSIKTFSSISYFVIRDKKDSNFYKLN